MINYIIINGTKYNIEDGVTLNDKATEELDTLTFRLVNVEPITLEPFKKVIVVFKNEVERTFIINTWIDEVATFSGLKNYTISCISETKKLERVALPNMTITQPLGLSNDDKRKYDIYLNRVMKYVNEVYPELELSLRLINKMKEVIAVEEQFNSPNSKEFFNSVLEKINSIVRVEDNMIDYFDLSRSGLAIDESKILFRNNAQTIEEYYSDIVTDVQGVQSEDATIITELVGVRSPENAVVTYDNAVVQLSHNINYLKEVIVWVHYKNEGKTQGYRIYGNQYKFIKEKAEYDLLKTSNKLIDTDINLKRRNLYFTRGKNTIEGLNYTEKSWFIGLSSMTSAIENIISYINNDKDTGLYFDGDIRDLKFEVTYSALDDVSTKFEKDTTTKSVVRDNQTDSYIDLDKFAKAEQEKINRLGNPTLEINARYTDLSEVPELMDYIGDYILAEREIVYHRHYIDFKGVLYKDYVKKNLFYGVNAKKRSYNLMLGNEAVTRKELIKLNYEFSFDDTTYVLDKKTQRYLLGKIVSSNLDLSNTSAILYGAWLWNDELTSFAFDTSEEEQIIKGEFYYISDNNFPIELYQIGARYDDVTGSYVLKYYPRHYDAVVVYNNGWNHDNYKRFEVVKYQNLATQPPSNDFLLTLQNNALKIPAVQATLPKDEYGITDLDFKPIQIAVASSYLANGTTLKYKLEPDVRKANTGVTINFKWYDNINVGMKFDGIKPNGTIEDLIDSKGGYGQQYVTYTDENGEVDNINIELYDRYDYNIAEDDFDYVDNYPEMSKMALLNTDYTYNFLEFTDVVKKDNREILNYTIHINFTSKDGIYITDRFVDMLPFFKKPKQKLYIWTSQGRYNQYTYDKVLPDAVRHENDLEIDYSDFVDFIQNYNAFNKIKLYNKDVSLNSINSYAIADAEGNVYIAVNTKLKIVGGKRFKQTTIYLNKKGE